MESTDTLLLPRTQIASFVSTQFSLHFHTYSDNSCSRLQHFFAIFTPRHHIPGKVFRTPCLESDRNIPELEHICLTTWFERSRHPHHLSYSSFMSRLATLLLGVNSAASHFFRGCCVETGKTVSSYLYPLSLSHSHVGRR